jgi:hypothetical protein
MTPNRGNREDLNVPDAVSVKINATHNAYKRGHSLHKRTMLHSSDPPPNSDVN